MTISPIPAIDQSFGGPTHKITLTYADVAALGASADNSASPLNIFPGGSDSFVAGTEITLKAIKLITAFDFSDTGITSLTLKVGDGDAAERYRAASGTQLAVDGTEVFHYDAATSVPHVYIAADTLDAIFTSANGGSPLLSECTSGQVDIFIRVQQQNKLV